MVGPVSVASFIPDSFTGELGEVMTVALLKLYPGLVTFGKRPKPAKPYERRVSPQRELKTIMFGAWT